MKNFKKLMALVIAAVMVVGSMNAFASDMVNPSYDGQIAITGLAANDTVNFYQILEWKGNDGTYAGWSLKAPFDGIVDTSVPALKDAKTAIATIVGDPTGNPAVDFGLTSEIAGKLAKLATTGAQAGTNTNGTATLNVTGETGLGLYMALITPADANTVYNPVFVSADYNTGNNTSSQGAIPTSTYSDSSAAKKGTINVTKTDLSSTKSYDQTWRSTRPGEVVAYKVETTIPGYGKVYTNPHFVIKDKLTDLKLVDTPAITLVKPANLVKGEGTADVNNTEVDYYIEKAADGKSYTITFTKKYLKTVNAPTDVEITYSAEVTTDAKQNVNVEENEVWVEYSHNPQDENDYDYKKDDTNHYTFTIDANILGGGESLVGKSGNEIIKVGVDAAGNPITSTWQYSEITDRAGFQGPLEGATFKLYKDYNTSTKTGTEYTKADGTTFTNLKSDGNGRITIEGLDAGTYYLVEEAAPNGYIKDLTPVKIEISYTTTTQNVKMYTDGNDWSYTKTGNFKDEVNYSMEVLASYTVKINDSATTTHTFYNEQPQKSLVWVKDSSSEAPSSIVNTKGVELPSTGGMGTTLFYAIGAILVLGAGILLVSKRRMSAN